MRHIMNRIIAQMALAAFICAVLLILPVLGEEEMKEMDPKLRLF